jgi:hypothetical protein
MDVVRSKQSRRVRKQCLDLGKAQYVPVKLSTRNLREGTGISIETQWFIVSLGWSPAVAHTSPGTVSKTHTCTGRGRRLPNWCTMDIATLPPKECPRRAVIANEKCQSRVGRRMGVLHSANSAFVMYL